jgi:hypothetical protein
LVEGRNDGFIEGNKLGVEEGANWYVIVTDPPPPKVEEEPSV